jgi:hypothetical protein
VISHGGSGPRRTTRQSWIRKVNNLASLAVGGKPERCLLYSMRLRLMVYSLDAINASLAEVQRSLVSLTNAVTSTVPRQPPEDDGAPIRQQSRHQHESTLMANSTVINSSTTSVAPIQVVRNMNYWITGRRPDGKTEMTVRGDTSTVSFETSSELDYIRA